MKKYAYIRALASALPKRIEDNAALPPRYRHKLGIEERHLAADDEAASDLAATAAERLFSRHGVDRSGIDFLLVCTQTPDHAMPSTSCLLQKKLSLSRHCGALDLNLGCSGYVYGLALAKGLLETGMAHRLLLITVSTLTKCVSREDRATWPLFGDAAAATLLETREAEEPLLSAFAFGTDGAGYDSIIIPAGGSRSPMKTTPVEHIVDAPGSSRTNYDVYMNGMEVASFTLDTVPSLVEEVLQRGSITRQQLDGCIFHQANRFLLEYLQKKCDLMEVPYYNDIRHTGNTVASTIPLAIERLCAEGADVRGFRHVLLAGFGVGFSWAGCLADLRALSDESWEEQHG